MKPYAAFALGFVAGLAALVALLTPEWWEH